MKNTLNLATIHGLLTEFSFQALNQTNAIFNSSPLPADADASLVLINAEFAAKKRALRYIAMRCGASDCTTDALNELFNV
jgi:hypothetical protein